MWKRSLGFIMILSFFFDVQSQETTENEPEMSPTIHPSKGVVIAVLTVMFSISFLLLAYVKFCRSSPLEFGDINLQGLTPSGSRYSGIDKQVIEALPFFKFSSLKGSKEGLECAVCLSKFEDSEVLRLLPKCKHGFHMNCIDKWLERHSSCPLCRYKVDPKDIKTFTSSISSRFLRVPSNLTEDPNLEISVQRDQSPEASSRFNYWKLVQKLNHKIVISDVATRSRWSDLCSSDLLSLNSEMLSVMSSARFSSSNEEENLITLLNEKRSMSEIANVSRFEEIRKEESSGNNGKEERVSRIWLSIVERTVQWFARRDRSFRDLEHKPIPSDV